LGDPDILLLDEATSALDPGTEAAIDATLARLAKGRTLISVTHRLASVVGVDRIFVLRKGRVVEQGSHKELLNQKGYYYQLWNEYSLQLTEDMLVAEMDTTDLSV
jgi:ATP-binding cassette subfamily B protein